MSRKNTPEVQEYIEYVNQTKKCAEVITLREWYDSTKNHSIELINYMDEFSQLGRLGKELHNRNVPRVTERFGDEIGTLVEATYTRGILDFAAPLCALACTSYRKK